MILEQIEKISETLIEALAGLGIIGGVLRKLFSNKKLKDIDRKLDELHDLVLAKMGESDTKIAIMQRDLENYHERLQRVEYGSTRNRDSIL